MGLMSDGGVHSHNTHLYGIMELAKRSGVDKVYIHCFMDGRDVPPTSGKDYLAELYKKCDEIGVGEIATVMGRYYAMDRDNRWERVVKAYKAMTEGEGVKFDCACKMMEESYANDVTDEFIVPAVSEKAVPVKDNDSIVSLTSAPTERERSPEPLSTPHSAASRESSSRVSIMSA